MTMDMRIPPGITTSHYAIQLCGGGRLVFLEWDEEQGRHIEHFVPDGDIADFLWKTICVAEETSLRDVLLLVERDEVLFRTLCGSQHIPALLDEMRSEGGDDIGEDNIPISLELGWSATLFDGIFQYESVFDGRAATGETLAIEFSPMWCLADLPIVLNESFVLIDDEEPTAAVFAARRPFTLYDLVSGILGELTVLGGPGDRDRMAEDIRQRVRDFQDGNTKGYTLEEVMEHMAIKAEESRRRFPCRECGEDARCACFGKPTDLCHICFAKMKEN